MYVSLAGMKCVYFVNLSTMTSIMSYLVPVALSVEVGSFVMKSIVTSSQGCVGGVLNCIRPYFSCRAALFLWQCVHFLT